MSTFGQRLKQLRIELSLTQKQLAKIVGVSRPTISLYEIDKSEPNDELKKKFADLFNVSVDYLTCHSNTRNSEKVYKNLNQLNIIKIPVIKSVLKAPIFSDDNILSYIYVNEHKAMNGTYFFAKVCDDDMLNARIIINDLVYIRKQTILENNDIVLLIIDNKISTIRRVLKSDNKFFFISENPNTHSILPLNSNIRVIGKVIEVLFKI